MRTPFNLADLPSIRSSSPARLLTVTPRRQKPPCATARSRKTLTATRLSPPRSCWHCALLSVAGSSAPCAYRFIFGRMLARVHTHTHACAQNQMALRALRAFRLRKALAFVRYIADTARTTRRIYMRCQAKPTHGIHYVQAHTFRRCMHHGTRDVSIPRLLYYTYSITYIRRANSQQQPAADRVYVVCKYCTRAREWQCVCVCMWPRAWHGFGMS